MKREKRGGEKPLTALRALPLKRNGPCHFHSHFIGKASHAAKTEVAVWESINLP